MSDRLLDQNLEEGDEDRFFDGGSPTFLEGITLAPDDLEPDDRELIPMLGDNRYHLGVFRSEPKYDILNPSRRPKMSGWSDTTPYVVSYEAFENDPDEPQEVFVMFILGDRIYDNNMSLNDGYGRYSEGIMDRKRREAYNNLAYHYHKEGPLDDARGPSEPVPENWQDIPLKSDREMIEEADKLEELLQESERKSLDVARSLPLRNREFLFKRERPHRRLPQVMEAFRSLAAEQAQTKPSLALPTATTPKMLGN